jgi:pyrimidine-specific ribonucleoside hydrolase
VKRIIIDTDPGIDDALAILFALGLPGVSVEGLTTVSGNVPVEQGTHNALTILEAVGRTDIPVAKGAAYPLRRRLITAEEVHGENGLAGLNLPQPSSKVHDLSAVEWLRHKLRTSLEPITIVAIGPLTNLGMLYCLDPEAFAKIEEIVFMGGAAFCSGNTTSAAEFNILVDPDAARHVVQSGVPLTMVGLDVTQKATLFAEDLARFEGQDSPLASFARRLLEATFAKRTGKIELGGIHLHDPLAVGVAVNPEIVQSKRYYLAVETEGEVAVGQTVVDDRPWSKNEPNATVAVDVDRERFLNWFLDVLTH